MIFLSFLIIVLLVLIGVAALFMISGGGEPPSHDDGDRDLQFDDLDAAIYEAMARWEGGDNGPYPTPEYLGYEGDKNE